MISKNYSWKDILVVLIIKFDISIIKRTKYTALSHYSSYDKSDSYMMKAFAKTDVIFNEPAKIVFQYFKVMKVHEFTELLLIRVRKKVSQNTNSQKHCVVSHFNIQLPLFLLSSPV